MSIAEQLHDALWGPVREVEMRLAIQAREEKLLSGADFEFFLPAQVLSLEPGSYPWPSGRTNVQVRLGSDLLKLPLERPSLDRPVRLVRTNSKVLVEAYRTVRYDISNRSFGSEPSKGERHGFHRQGDSDIVSTNSLPLTWFDDQSYIGDRFGYCVDFFSDTPRSSEEMRSTKIDPHGPVWIGERTFENVWTTHQALLMGRNTLGIFLNRNMLYSVQPSAVFHRQLSWSWKAYGDYQTTSGLVVRLTSEEEEDFGVFLRNLGATYVHEESSTKDPQLMKLFTQESS